MNILETRGLTKDFPGVRALDHFFDLELREGEIHGLVGENGAGKSTLVKMLTGVFPPTEGQILLCGREVRFASPRDSAPYIGVVHQERELIGHFTGAENLFLGEEKTRLGFVDRKAMQAEAQKLLQRWNVSVPLDCPVEDLGSGQQEMIMIMKVLLKNPRAVIFDEPTAALSAGECEILFGLIGELKKRGIAILYISHNLPEVLQLCDRVTVMRNGRKTAEADQDVTEQELIRLMVDHDLQDQYPKETLTIGQDVLRLEAYACDRERISEASLHIRSGEIVGFAGLAGAGRTELARGLFCGEKHRGRVFLREKAFCSASPRQSIRQGMVMIPEDRRGEGIIPSLSVNANLVLPGIASHLSLGGLIDFVKTRRAGADAVERYGIRISDIRQAVETLSGGNQQKVSVGKWDGFHADLWIFDEPTQGIDVEAKREIYRIMGRVAAQGAGVWFISSDLRELLNISDRIYVMNRRRIASEFRRPFDSEAILAAMMKAESACGESLSGKAL